MKPKPVKMCAVCEALVSEVSSWAPINRADPALEILVSRHNTLIEAADRCIRVNVTPEE